MPLRFLHIPKTAGATFEEILRRQYRGKSHFFFDGHSATDIARFNRLTDVEKSRVELFMGHAPITTGVPEADHAPIITFLRDPIKRVKSFCQHVSEGKSPYLEQAYAPGTFNLDQFLDSGNTELVNLQTKMLINTSDNASSALLDTLSADEARDRALANLFNRVAYFGLTEFFDASLMIFSQALAWSTPFYFSINRPDAARLIEFKEHHLRRIAEMNQIDIQVYNVAQAHFMTMLNSPQFDKARLARFQSRNALLSPAMNLQYLVRMKATSLAQRLAHNQSKTEMS